MNAPLDALKLALQQSPDNVPLRLLVAAGCLNDLWLDEARGHFQHVLTLQPRHPEALLGLARVSLMEGKSSEAAVRAEQLLTDQPSFAPAMAFLAKVLASEGDLPRARSLYHKAVELDRGCLDAGLQKMFDEAKDETPKPARLGASSDGGAPRSFDGNGDADEISSDRLGVSEFERPTLSFSHVGGMDALKEEIRMKIIHPLQNPDLFRAYGKRAGGGVLLYGPPGCGKTLISKATAGEIKATFIAVGLHNILDMWIGQSEKHLHNLFELARKSAPCILFFDEVDALAADRRDLRQSAGRTLINQFLAEMDGAQSENDGVLVLGATNAPWHIDPAFRRPGRFDRTLFVPPPDQSAREEIVRLMSRDKPVGELDGVQIARKTDGFSGADLKAMFDLAIEEALAAAMKSGKVVPITSKDLLRAASRHQPTTRAWFASAKNYAMYSNQSGMYDDVLRYLGIKKD